MQKVETRVMYNVGRAIAEERAVHSSPDYYIQGRRCGGTGVCNVRGG